MLSENNIGITGTSLLNLYHDLVAHGYDEYQRDIEKIADDMLTSYLATRKSSHWKPAVQKSARNLGQFIYSKANAVYNKNCELYYGKNIVITDRGKERLINNEPIHNRTLKRYFSDCHIFPVIKKFLHPKCGASIPGKGTDYMRREMERDLRKMYRKHGNRFYVLSLDFRRYYDNIDHEKAYKVISAWIKDEYVLEFIKLVISRAGIDATNCTPEEFEQFTKDPINFLELYREGKVDVMREGANPIQQIFKRLNLGCQVAQFLGVLFPTLLDNFISNVEGNRYYGRYMDDLYVLHEDKEYLKALRDKIIVIAAELGIHVNLKKTSISSVTNPFKFLQIYYRVNDTGRIVKYINKKKIKQFRHRMKSHLKVFNSAEEYIQWLNAWYNSLEKHFSYHQAQSIQKYFKDFIRKDLTNYYNL